MFELKLEANKTGLTLGQYNNAITAYSTGTDNRAGEVNSRPVGSLRLFAIVDGAVVTMSVLSVHVPLLSAFTYMPSSAITGSYSNPRVSFAGEPPNCLPQWLDHFTCLQVMYRGSSFSTSWPTVISVIFVTAIIGGMKWCLIVIWVCIFLKSSHLLKIRGAGEIILCSP